MKNPLDRPIPIELSSLTKKVLKSDGGSKFQNPVFVKMVGVDYNYAAIDLNGRLFTFGSK